MFRELTETIGTMIMKLLGNFSIIPFKTQISLPNRLIIADISLPVRDIIPSLIYTPPRENLSGFTSGTFPYNSSQGETPGVLILPLDQWKTDPSQVITLSILPGR